MALKKPKFIRKYREVPSPKPKPKQIKATNRLDSYRKLVDDLLDDVQNGNISRKFASNKIEERRKDINQLESTENEITKSNKFKESYQVTAQKRIDDAIEQVKNGEITKKEARAYINDIEDFWGFYNDGEKPDILYCPPIPRRINLITTGNSGIGQDEYFDRMFIKEVGGFLNKRLGNWEELDPKEEDDRKILGQLNFTYGCGAYEKYLSLVKKYKC